MIYAGTAFAADDATVCAVVDESDVDPVISDVDVASDELNSPKNDELILNDTNDILEAGNGPKNTHFVAVDNLTYESPMVAEGYALYPILLTTGDIIPVPLSNKVVSVEFNGVKNNYNTNSTGAFFYYIPSNTHSGTYKLNMKFAGDERYKGCELTTTIKVVDVSSQIIALENASYPRYLVMSGLAYYPILLTSNTTIPVPLANKAIRVKFNGVEKRFTTNEYGVFNYTLNSGLAPGSYPIKISYDGGNGYKPTTFATNVEVYDVPTKIIALENASYPISLVTSGLAYYPILLTADYYDIDVNGTIIPITLPLANKDIKVRFNGGAYSKYTTNEYGVFNYTLDSSLAPGSYTIEVSYDGDKGYMGSYFKTTVKISDAPPSQIIAADNVSYPLPLVVEGRSYYPISLTTNTTIPVPLANKTVHVKFNGVDKEFITDNYGLINYVIPYAPAGNYTIEMRFAGDASSSESSLTTHVGLYDVETKISAPANMTYEVSDVKKGTAVYPIILTTNTSVPVSLVNKTVSVKFNGIVSQYTTNEVGLINYVIPVNTPTGNFTVGIIFEGQGGYAPVNATGIVEITGINTKIIAPSSMTVRVNDLNKTYFNLTLLDSDGNKLANQVISIEFNGAVTNYITDKNGAIHYPLSGTPIGTHIISMNYAGAGNYVASSASSSIVVVSIQKQAKIFLRNALYFVLQDKYVTVTLWDANNNPIVGKTVYINLDEYGLKYSGVTDKDGNANIRVGVGFGNHPATVSFEGDEQYTACERTGSVRVIKETPSLMLPGAYTKFKASDATKTIKVYLKDRYNKPLLPGTKVFVKINGKQYVGLLDNEGIASINIDLKNVGVYDVELYYTGNTAYNEVKRTTKITIV